MKLVPESLVESMSYHSMGFHKSGDVKSTMNLGIAAQFKKFMQGVSYSEKQKEPLWVCASQDKPLFVKYLIESGADVNANDNAALRWACGRGFEEVAKLLLDAGADPGASGTSYDECFKWARRKGHTNIIDILNRSIRGEIFFEQPEQEARPVHSTKDLRREPPTPEQETEDDSEENNWI